MIDAFKNDPLYQTERLIIRRIEDTDLSLFHEMQSDFEVMKYAAGKVLNLEENTADIKKIKEAYITENNTFWIWAIQQQSGDFIGTIAMVHDKESNWEIGYRFLRSEWGKGYATESAIGMVNFITYKTPIQNIVAYADLRNQATLSVLNKAGFINLGIKYNDEESFEEYIFSISTIDTNENQKYNTGRNLR